MSDLIGICIPDQVNLHANYPHRYREEDLLTNYLSYDMYYQIFSYLDVFSLTSLSECSQFMHAISSDCNSWSKICEELWKDKIYICKESEKKLKCTFILHGRCKMAKTSLVPDHKDDNTFCQCCKEAYKHSYLDSKLRHSIKTEEICNFVWSFRFKESAGFDWISRDPWWNGKEAKKVLFLPDGRILKVANSKIQSINTRKRKSFYSENTRVEDNCIPNVIFDSEHFPVETMTWKFIATPLDLPDRDIGGYLRISIAGREIPTYVVRRSPTNNWGFIIENCWGLFSSFDMPLKGESIALEDANLLIVNSWQWKEALYYNMREVIL